MPIQFLESKTKGVYINDRELFSQPLDMAKTEFLTSAQQNEIFKYDIAGREENYLEL